MPRLRPATRTPRLSERLAMFPLNAGLLPGSLLPLRVFEPRYLAMIDRCLEGSREFGVVLISRGSEVGGGEQRYDVGTIATILGSREIGDGTTLTIARGGERLRVVEWLEDDPYPMAMVERLAETSCTVANEADRPRLESVFRRGLGLLSELGVDVRSARELAEDCGAAAFQAIALIPMEAIDRQRILEMDDPRLRLIAAIAAIEEANELTELRLSSQ